MWCPNAVLQIRWGKRDNFQNSLIKCYTYISGMMPGQVPPQMPPGMVPPQMMMQRPMIPGMPGMPPHSMAVGPGGPPQIIPGGPRPPMPAAMPGVRPVSLIIRAADERRYLLMCSDSFC